MRDGFIKVAAVTPKVRVADVKANEEELCKLIIEASDHQACLLYTSDAADEL